MLVEPTDLDRVELTNALERHWKLRPLTLNYLPVGFGSHHWRAVDANGTEHFVTVDDLAAGFQAIGVDTAFAALERAYATATFLRDEAGLDFVVAPRLDEDGKVIRRLSDRYAVTVSPLVEGETSQWGPWESRDDRRAMGEVLGRLHSVTALVPDGLPRRDDLAIPSRAVVMDALGELDRPWSSGPFAEPTRQLLTDTAPGLMRRFSEYDQHAAEVRASAEPWVISHGEPHRANVIRAATGAMLLVDWDTTLIAPRERDLRMVLDDELTGWHQYVGFCGDASLNQRAIELYRLWWDLADTSIYVALFRQPHERDENTVAAWDNLVHCLGDADLRS